MPLLILRHIEQPTSTDSPRFQLIKPDGVTLGPIEVKPAAGYPVEGRPNDDLMSELRWYLEDFLEYPFHPETEHAERVLRALKGWAVKAFDALFGSGEGADLFARTTGDGADPPRLRIESTDPSVLSWPWEVMGREEEVPMGQRYRFERSLGSLETSPTPLAELPRDRVNILLVTARPEGERDVGFRSISRPMIDWVEKEKLPVDVHVLRPPTFERLSEHLQERPEHYHILHFDGHGAYRPTTTGNASAVPPERSSSFQLRTADAQQLKSYEGCLIFEDDIGGDRAIKASQLSSLLLQHRVPIVVLNACQSAMLDDAAETAFASVAASLIHAGTRSVVAMAYSLYVSAASEFLPAFYRGLFTSGSVAEGVRAGRRRLAQKRGRVCARGRFDLEDWLVPVLYQQDDVDLSFAAEARERNEASQPPVLDLDGESPLKHFVGRDGAILQLERAFRRKPAGILIHGLGGVGKTTLARGFLDWLARTEGLGKGCLWLSFQEVRSAEYVWNRLGERMVGHQIAALEAEQKIALLAQIFRENRFVIVWDNFEVVAGITGSTTMPTLSKEDRRQLEIFLTKLCGGKTKVIMTSRSSEAWLKRERHIVALSGLQGEERWSYCNHVLSKLDAEIDREDPDLEELMDQLGGHPLAMRVLLPELARRSASQLIEALRSNFAKLELDDGDAAKLYATLGFVEEALDPKHRPLLIPLAFHERFVQANTLEAMAQNADPTLSRLEVDALMRALADAGLLRDLGQAIFEMHPALTGFLRSTVLQRATDAARDPWARAFVDVFATLANALAPRQAHEQRVFVHLHGVNFLVALEKAERREMVTDTLALLLGLGAFAQNQRLFDEAEKYYKKFADLQRRHDDRKLEAGAYHQLGMITQEKRNLEAAENWYRKALAINERLGDEHDAAITYHQLGIISEEKRDFEAAEKWFRKSLVIKEDAGNEQGAAITYHHLGIIAQEKRDFHSAEKWYRKSLAINERNKDEHGAAGTYHQLGMSAQKRRDFDAAKNWFRKSLIINEELGNEHRAAATYHHLGTIAQDERDFDTARKWHHKSLAINEKHGNEHGAATTYHQLGMIAQDERDFDTAEKWHHKSLAIKEKSSNEHGAATTYHQLGVIAQERQDFDAAKNRYRKSLAINEKFDDEYGAAFDYHQLGILAEDRGDFEAAEGWYRKSLAIKEKSSNQHEAAITYNQLGRIAQEKGDFETAEKWYRKSLVINERSGNPHDAASSYHQLGIIAQEKRDFKAAEEWYRKSLAIKEKSSNQHRAANTYNQLGIIAGLQRRYEESGRWLIKCVGSYIRTNESHHLQTAARNFMVLYRRAPPSEQAKLRSMWKEAGLP